MRANPDGTTTPAEFVSVWFEAEEALKRKIAKTESEIGVLEVTRDETVVGCEQGVKLRAVKEHEKLNSNMILEQSKLTIEVLDGRGFALRNGNPFVPYVCIVCEHQRYELRPPEMVGDQAVWNERIAM